jgi:putative ABC transport system permease protein
VLVGATGRRTTVRVAGIVDLPNADSLFQHVGAPPGALQAPPDNVVILPLPVWQKLVHSGVVDRATLQLHVRLKHDLPSDPQAALVEVQRRAHRLEALLAGNAVVGDNLAARLAGARADSLYARVLFLFLGAPGIVLAALLTLTVASAGAAARRREQALLRLRGATLELLARLAALEAAGVAVSALVAGALCGAIVIRLLNIPEDAVAGAGGWLSATLAGGFFLALFAWLGPALAAARDSTVVQARMSGPQRYSVPWWERFFVDVALLAVAAVVYARVAAAGYQVVLAPEGVAQASVSYESFLAPLCLWLGGALLVVRCARALLARRRALGALIRPVAGSLVPVVAASLSRRRADVARELVFVVLAFAFAGSTAIFDATYNAQSLVDARLTNGADVTVTGSTSRPASSRLGELRALPGVVAAEPLVHRYAYVGNDLQDLYGVDPRTFGNATSLSDAYFVGGVRRRLAALTAHEDAVLVSAETAADFQLHDGDRVNLRLQDRVDGRYHVVPFRFAGIAREFPTAPKDSFLVANAAYVQRATHDPVAEVVLLRAAGDPVALKGRVLAVVSGLPGVRVTDITEAQRTIASSLTAIDLRGLSAVELAFALLFAVGATSAIIALNAAELRTTFALLSALGARARHVGAFLWSEALLSVVAGAALGLALGVALAGVLVRMLTGVFDPPPETLTIPVAYLSATTLGTLAIVALTVLMLARRLRAVDLAALRDR